MKNKILLGFLFICFSIISYGQDTTGVTNYYCHIHGKKDWQKVEIQIIDSSSLKKRPYWIGSYIITRHPIKKLTDLTEKEVRRIKKETAKCNCCIVYVDINKMLGYVLEKNELSYCIELCRDNLFQQ